jgi:hypothetical protein
MKKTPHNDNSFQRFLIDKKEQLSLTGISVFADWMLVLGTLSILFIGLIAWSWTINEEVLANSSLQEDKQATLRSRVDMVLLEQVATKLGDKQKRFETLTNGFVFNDRVPVAAPLIDTSGVATSTPATSTAQ